MNGEDLIEKSNDHSDLDKSLKLIPNSNYDRGFTPSKVTFGGKYRYFILLLGWLCLTSISSNMVALNFTLICMSAPVVSTSESIYSNTSEQLGIIFTHLNETSTKLPERSKFELYYTANEKNFLLWSVAVGSMLGTFPFSWLYTRYGARNVLFWAGIISAASTALIPIAAFNSFILFLVLRFFQGIAYSADFAAMGMICSRWASLKQNALFISVLTCYSPLSSTLTNPISGMICESRYGWPMVYYAHSIVCVFLFLLWLFFYNDHPRVNRFVSDAELEKINRNKTDAHINMDKFVPYKAILRDRLVWLVWLNAFVDLFSGMFILMYLPTYLKYVLNYSIEKTGFLGALPTFSHMPLKFIFGYSSDKFRCLPERTKMIIFNTLAVGMPGVFYLGVGFIPDDQPLCVVLVFTLILMFFATAGGGFYKCGSLYSRQYSHFIIANIQFVKCLTLFLGPTLMAIFVSDERRKEEWRYIFILMAISLFIANIMFCREATDEPAEFTKVTSVSKNGTEKEKPLLIPENEKYLTNIEMS